MKIISSGNKKTDALHGVNFIGLVINHRWYKTIRKNGKPYFTAITVLADIVDKYNPIVINDGSAVTLKKKFDGDILLRTYKMFEQDLNLTRREIYNALVFLEELGVIKRVFRTITAVEDGHEYTFNNVLHIDLFVDRLAELS